MSSPPIQPIQVFVTHLLASFVSLTCVCLLRCPYLDMYVEEFTVNDSDSASIELTWTPAINLDRNALAIGFELNVLYGLAWICIARLCAHTRMHTTGSTTNTTRCGGTTPTLHPSEAASLRLCCCCLWTLLPRRSHCATVLLKLCPRANPPQRRR